MLRELLGRLCKELSIPPSQMNEHKEFRFRVTKDLEIHLRDLEPGVAIKGQIIPCPAGKREDLFAYLMRANLLGQGTGGSRIGMDAEEKFLTLSLGLPYEMDYQLFKDSVEDFVNYLVYWRDNLANFDSETTILS